MTRQMMMTAAAIAVCASPVAASAQQAKPARIQGVIFDSTRAAPLGSSVVEMIDAKDPLRIWRTTSTSRGEFSFDSLASGTYFVSVSHPRLDSLGVRSLTQGVQVAEQKRARVRLAIPSSGSLVRRVCGDTLAADQQGYVRGVLRDADRMSVAVQGMVEVGWVDMSVEGNAVRRQMTRLRGKTDSEGNFVVCGVPPEGIVQLQAWSGRDSSGVVDIMIPSNGVSSHDMFVGRYRTVLQRVVDSAGVVDSAAPLFDRVRRGEARIRGRVTTTSGAPMSGALLSVRGTGVEQRVGANGEFVLTGLPTGTYLAEVRAIGYAPIQRVVNVVPEDTAVVNIALDRAAKLDTMRIMARRGTFGASLFAQEVKMSGLAHVLTPEKLDRDRPMRMSDMFRTIPGVWARPGPFGDSLLMRGPSLQPYCTPLIWIDGVLAMSDMPLDLIMSPEQVVGAIVYTSAGSAPAQYGGTGNGCGAILLFTGDRQAAMKR